MQIQKVIATQSANLVHNIQHIRKVSEESSVVATQLFEGVTMMPKLPLPFIQDAGMKVFEGMTKKEIEFVMRDLQAISISRGCSHKCTTLLCFGFASEKKL